MDQSWNIHPIEDGSFSNRFKRFIFSIGDSIESFKLTCRSLISIDVCSKSLGTMLIAVTNKDADHKLFSIAFGIAKIEHESSWRWFFENLQKALLVECALLNLNLDSVEFCFSNIFHCLCSHRISNNILGKYKDMNIVQ